jgi:PAS domain S-box-containing protein
LTSESNPSQNLPQSLADPAAQKTAEHVQEHFRLAQAAAQIGTWEWDPVADESTLSPELHTMFGTDPSKSGWATAWDANVHPEDMARMPALFEAADRTGSIEFEYRYIHPTKGQRWFFCKGGRMAAERRMFGIVMDITDRKLAEEVSTRLAAIVQSSDDAIISKDLNGVITSWNPAAERMFGYKAEEMIGRPIILIIPPELHSDEDMILGKIRRGEKIDHFETVRVTKTGEKLDVSITVSPLKDQSGRVVGAAKIARDVGQRKRAEEALRISEKLASVGRLAATVAHEINNPLAAVVNLVYLIKRSADLPALVKQYVNMAEEELNRISSLTRQTLGFYREERGAAQMRVGGICRNLVSIFSAKAANKSIHLNLQARSDPEIHAVKDEIRQLIANLLGNSIDAVPQNGFVILRISRATRHRKGQLSSGVRLTIADSGPGIPQHIRARIFEPFFTTKKDVGTGLGLWISKTIVDKHNGSLRLRSSTKPEKSWTVFSIFLPAQGAESAALGMRAEKAASLVGQKS